MNEQEAATLDESKDTEVDRALARLAQLDELPVDQHVAVYEDIHTTLRATLNRPAGG